MQMVFKNPISCVMWQWRTAVDCPPCSHSSFWLWEPSALWCFYWYLPSLAKWLTFTVWWWRLFFFFTFGYPLISMEDETLALPISFLSFWYWHNKFWFYQYVDIKILWLSILHNQIICLYYDYIILYFIFSWKLITSSSFSLPLLYSCF